MQKTKKYSAKTAFTLVELIVVITILAILWTIAFISLQWYSSEARDSTRISDLSSMKSALELFQLDAWKYPEPSNGVSITYSWSLTAWTQWTFWQTVFNNTSKLDKIPLDPSTDKEYVYSTTQTRNEYQLAWALESGDMALNKNIESAMALEKKARLKIVWTYNWKLLKVMTWSTAYILAMPSLMSASGTTVESILSNKTLWYNWYRNLPSQYAWNYVTLWETNLNLVNAANILVYSWDISILSKSDSTWTNARKTMLENLQTAYSWSAIKAVWEIANILSTDINNTWATENLTTYMVKNDLWWSVKISWSTSNNTTTSNSCATQPSYTHAIFTAWSATSADQAWQNTNSNDPCYYTCENWYTWSDCSTQIICNYWEVISNWQCSDPYWNNVILMMHGEWINNWTTFTDEKWIPFTPYWNVVTTTGQKKFWGSSLLFDWAWDYLEATSSTNFTATWDWTVEAWIFFNSFSWPQYSCPIINYWLGSNDNLLLRAMPSSTSPSQVNAYVQISWAIPTWQENSWRNFWPNIHTGNWYHVAFVRSSWIFYYFVDWQLWTSIDTATSFSMDYNMDKIRIWSAFAWSNPYLNWYIDELRVTKWVARYSTGFTVPVQEFPNQ